MKRVTKTTFLSEKAALPSIHPPTQTLPHFLLLQIFIIVIIDRKCKSQFRRIYFRTRARSWGLLDSEDQTGRWLPQDRRALQRDQPFSFAPFRARSYVGRPCRPHS